MLRWVPLSVLLVGSLVSTACGGSGSSTASSPVASRSPSVAAGSPSVATGSPSPIQDDAWIAMGKAAATKTVTFIAPAGSINDGFKSQLLPAFEAATGIKVNYIPLAAPQALAQITAQRAAPQIDVFWGSDGNRIQGTKQGLFASLDKARLPNLKNTADQFQLGDSAQGFGVSQSANGLVYNTKVFSERGWAPPTSFEDLWDVKYKGHVGSHALPTSVQAVFLVGMAKLYGGSESNVAPGFARFQALKPNLFAIYASTPELDQGFAQGSVWIAAASVTSRKAAATLEFVKPKEGLGTIRNQMMLVKGSPNPDAAYAFANYMLTVAVQSKLPDAIAYGPVARDAVVPAAQRPYVALPTDKVIQVDWEIVSEKLADWTEQWQRDVERK